MSYYLDFSKEAQKDIDFHRKSGNKSIVKKLLIILNELSEHPYRGTGKPEQLKYDLVDIWSRRINKEYRLVYEIVEDKILIHSARGHYL